MGGGYRVATQQEAVTLANDSKYGLAANVFSVDEERADRVASRLRAGKVKQFVPLRLYRVADPAMLFRLVLELGFRESIYI